MSDLSDQGSLVDLRIGKTFVSHFYKSIPVPTPHTRLSAFLFLFYISFKYQEIGRTKERNRIKEKEGLAYLFIFLIWKVILHFHAISLFAVACMPKSKAALSSKDTRQLL